MKTIFLTFVLALSSIAANSQPVDENTEVKKVVYNFFNWYKTNWKKLAAFSLYRGKVKSNAPPYTIDWKEVQRYYTYLRKSVPFVGEAFIQSEKAFFQKAQQEFDTNPADEVPPSFDYDRFLGSQEDANYVVDSLLFKSTTKHDITISGDVAEMIFTSQTPTAAHGVVVQKSMIELTKEKGRWKISKNIWPLD